MSNRDQEVSKLERSVTKKEMYASCGMCDYKNPYRDYLSHFKETGHNGFEVSYEELKGGDFMGKEEEYERTFLARYLPNDISSSQVIDLRDIYVPQDSAHPTLRIRKNGNKTVITKKTKINTGNASEFLEDTISLSDDEYNALSGIPGKDFSKKRHVYEYAVGKTCEIDVYQERLNGLVVIDFECATIEEKDNLVIPDFCLVEVTEQEFLAGGKLCGKSYEELRPQLESLGYRRIE